MDVVGLLADSGAGVIPDVAYTSLEAGQALLGRGDLINGVRVVLADGVDPGDWIDAQRGRPRRLTHHPGGPRVRARGSAPSSRA